MRDETHLQPSDLGIGQLFWRVREAVVVGDAESGRIVLWNPAAELLFGYTADEAIGMLIECLIPPPLRPRHRAGLARFRATGTGQVIGSPTPIELPALRQDGREIAIELSLSELGRAPSGAPLVLAVIRDVTRRKEVEEDRDRLLQAETARSHAEAERLRLREIFRQAPAAIALLRGPDHVFEFVNPVFERLVGRTGLVGLAVRQALPEIAGQGYFELLDRVYATGEPHVGSEARVLFDRRGEGTLEERFVNFVYLAMRGLGGDVDGVLCHAVDVTDQVLERQRVEGLAAENARLYQEAQAGVQARDEFLSVAAHELKTPVTSIKGNAQFLLRAHANGRLDPERLLRGLRSLDAAAARLTRLTGDLLDVSRIRLGRLPLRRRSVDLCALLREVAARWSEHLASGHHLVLDTTESPCRQEVDPDRIEQVLVNLLDNAIKYSPEGGEVRVRVRPDAGGVLLQVIDQGIGLPAGWSRAIFEPFGRSPNAAAHHLAGFGLGLHISRDIIERHGGRIWAESPGENRGTTVSVWLPDEPAPGDASEAAAPPDRRPDPSDRPPP